MDAQHDQQGREVVSEEDDLIVIETSGTHDNPILLLDDDAFIYPVSNPTAALEDEVEIVEPSFSLETNTTNEVSPSRIVFRNLSVLTAFP